MTGFADISPLHEELKQIVSTCEQCVLHKERKQTVFHRGPIDAPMMIIGEAPGEDEDEQGAPFVGKAGQHLSDLLRAAGVPEGQIYMCNVLKCRPPKNKFPEGGEEPETCRGYLLKQISLIKPHVMVLCGKQPIRYVLLHGTTERVAPVNPWINKFYRRKDLFDDALLTCVYHPSYLMRRHDEVDEEAWVSTVAAAWSYANHKATGTAPAPILFRDLSAPPILPKRSRNLFSRGRGDIL